VVHEFPPQYLNKVYLGDVMDLLKSLPDQCVDMVYGDPDYNVGIKYGDKSYTRSFEEYIEWYIELARESLRVLKDDGNMFLMNYPKQNAYLRVKFLDEACYAVHDYVWIYNTNVGHSPRAVLPLPTEASCTVARVSATASIRIRLRNPTRTQRTNASNRTSPMARKAECLTAGSISTW